jgi:hypothetical protein
MAALCAMAAAALGVFGGFQITNFDVFLGMHNQFCCFGLLVCVD